MTTRLTVLKLRYALVGLAALAWTSHADAVPEDRDARAPPLATTNLACAEPRAPLPGCRDQRAPARMTTGEELVSGYVTRALATTAATRSSSSAPVPAKGSSQKTSTTLPTASTKVDDYLPIAHGLREAVVGLGGNAGAEILLAFVVRSVAADDDGERLRRLREMPATFPFATLLPFSASLSGVYRGEGARFNHVLFHAIDPQRLIAWNAGTPKSVPDLAERAPAHLSVGALKAYLDTNPPLWGVQGMGPEKKPGSLDDSAAKERRTIVYMQKGRTSVMTLEGPAPK